MKFWISIAVLAVFNSALVATTSRTPRTLAFVFDVTFSMVADLEHLKFGIQVQSSLFFFVNF